MLHLPFPLPHFSLVIETTIQPWTLCPPSSQEPCPGILANVINLRNMEGTLQFLMLATLSDLPIVILVS
jgi:hypothetical protein